MSATKISNPKFRIFQIQHERYVDVCDYCGEEQFGIEHSRLCPYHPDPYFPDDDVTDNDDLMEAYLEGEEV
jgi:hypothetical protein